MQSPGFSKYYFSTLKTFIMMQVSENSPILAQKNYIGKTSTNLHPNQTCWIVLNRTVKCRISPQLSSSFKNLRKSFQWKQRQSIEAEKRYDEKLVQSLQPSSNLWANFHRRLFTWDINFRFTFGKSNLH